MEEKVVIQEEMSIVELFAIIDDEDKLKEDELDDSFEDMHVIKPKREGRI